MPGFGEFLENFKRERVVIKVKLRKNEFIINLASENLSFGLLNSLSHAFGGRIWGGEVIFFN